jgi:hypothetical protein
LHMIIALILSSTASLCKARARTHAHQLQLLL